MVGMIFIRRRSKKQKKKLSQTTKLESTPDKWNRRKYYCTSKEWASFHVQLAESGLNVFLSKNLQMHVSYLAPGRIVLIEETHYVLGFL